MKGKGEDRLVDLFLDAVHIFMYTYTMKKRALEQRLHQLGWWLLRQGGSHEVWTNGEHAVAVPRHAEINEFTAKGILRKAQRNPQKK